MTHADALAVPEHITTKAAFYAHLIESLKALLAPSGTNDPVQQNWLSQLSNAASLLFGSFENFESVWGREPGRRVNWSGFYLVPSLFPLAAPASSPPAHLLLGPFHGRPACSSVSLTQHPTRPLGVCATSFVRNASVLVPNVHEQPGHIACDGVTLSELVVPLRNAQGDVVGVLDLDCEALEGFGEEDVRGIEEFARELSLLIVWV